MIHKCEGSVPGEAIEPRLSGVTVEGCFHLKEGTPLQIVYHDPKNREYDELFETVESCPFCGYTPEKQES